MRRTHNTSLSTENIRSSSEVLRALAHPLRIRMLAFIDQEKMVNVNTIYTQLGLEQSVTSQHLRILRSAGLVEPIRKGKFIFYVIDYEKVAEATKVAGMMADFSSINTGHID